MDILKEEDLVPHIKGSDAVVSCIGGRASLFGWTPCSLYTDRLHGEHCGGYEEVWCESTDSNDIMGNER